MRPGTVLDFVQPALPLAPAVSPPAPRFWRLVRSTTKLAYYSIRDRLPRKERVVYFGLMAYWNRYQRWPTGQELFEFLREKKNLQPRHPRYRYIVDINSVRPRLTDLNQHIPPLVVTRAEDRRLCQSHRAREARSLMRGPSTLLVNVWRIPQVGD